MVKARGQAVTTALLTICNKIWKIGKWPTLTGHPIKVMLKTILNGLKPQAEKIIAEKQAGFRAGRSTTEQISNLRILCKKHIQRQQDRDHVFIDFKKAFDRV